jgi:hypothetical protein
MDNGAIKKISLLSKETISSDYTNWNFKIQIKSSHAFKYLFVDFVFPRQCFFESNSKFIRSLCKQKLKARDLSGYLLIMEAIDSLNETIGSVDSNLLLMETSHERLSRSKKG